MSRILIAVLSFFAVFALVRDASATCNVIDWGAIPNDGLDDRAAVQDAIDDCHAAGDADVYFPPGEYLLGKAPFMFWSITVPSGTRLFGDNAATTSLRLPANTIGSHRLMYVYGSDTRIESLTLYGDRVNQTRAPTQGAEHRHAIFAVGTSRLTIDRVIAREFTGDGVYLYNSSDETVLRDCVLIDNDRSGISLASDLDRVLIVGNRIMRNGVQQIDTEPVSPATVNEVVITGNYIDGSNTNAQAVTLSGPSGTILSRGFVLSGNVIRGGVHVVYAEMVSITGNVILNHTSKGGVYVYRTARRVVVVGNTVLQTWVDTANVEGGVPALAAVGTGTGQMPEDVSFANNLVIVSDPDSWGVQVQGFLTATVRGNTLIGPGVASTYGAGIYIRASHQTIPVRLADVSGNTVRNFGKYGVLVSGNVGSEGVAKLRVLRLADNIFEDTSIVPTQVVGARIDDGQHPLESFSVRDNFCFNVTTCLQNVPPGATFPVVGTANNTGWVLK